MKKILLITAVLLFAATGAFAQQLEFTGTMTIGGGTETGGDDSETIAMGLSNNVTAVYEDGDQVQSQWYAIATSHLGGVQTYGTAQDMTSIFKLVTEKIPGTDPDFSGMPADASASEDWSSGLWDAL